MLFINAIMRISCLLLASSGIRTALRYEIDSSYQSDCRYYFMEDLSSRDSMDIEFQGPDLNRKYRNDERLVCADLSD